MSGISSVLGCSQARFRSELRDGVRRMAVTVHDASFCREFRRDDAGLTIMAYALGAALILVPLAILLWEFGSGAEQSARETLAPALNP